MKDPIVVVGSGASGVHFAQTALEKGRRILMLDVGLNAPPSVMPTETLNGLKRNLKDPVAYFLGNDFGSLILPGNKAEYYGFPPNKQHVFAGVDGFACESRNFAPLFSFAAGGLAEAWTGGAYPFNDADLADFPFTFSQLKPYYSRVACRIGICGARDDLISSFPWHDGLEEPLPLDEHSALLLQTYDRRKSYVNKKYRCVMGRARVATLTRDRGDRKACDYSGRCLWACPTKSLYTPSLTLEECCKYDEFEYVPGIMVSHFRFNSGGLVTQVIGRDIRTGASQTFKVGTLVLAGGTLCSSKIFLDSVYHDSGKIIKLPGLMDNRQVLMPFLNPRMVGRRYEPNSYQYHQLAIGVENEDGSDYVHGLLTTLKTALIHPIVQSIPTSLATAVSLFRNMRAGLGLANINFRDRPRKENHVTLDVASKAQPTRLRINYLPEADEGQRIRRNIRLFRKILRALGCIAPSKMTHVRPMGASVHYAGTIPMSSRATGPVSDASCRSQDFANLYFVDGTTFPSLPAKNLTFTLMANATRVADTSC